MAFCYDFSKWFIFTLSTVLAVNIIGLVLLLKWYSTKIMEKLEFLLIVAIPAFIKNGNIPNDKWI